MKKKNLMLALFTAFILSLTMAFGCGDVDELTAEKAMAELDGFNVSETMKAEAGNEFSIPGIMATGADGQIYNATIKVTLDGEEVAVEGGKFKITSIKDYIVTYTIKYKGFDLTKQSVIKVSDTGKPIVKIADDTERHVISTLCNLPEIRVEEDGGVKSTVITLTAPDGTDVKVTDGKFTPIIQGVYKLKVVVTDESGNEGIAESVLYVVADSEDNGLSFETGLPSFVVGHDSTVELSTEHVTDGSFSLKCTSSYFWPHLYIERTYLDKMFMDEEVSMMTFDVYNAGEKDHNSGYSSTGISNDYEDMRIVAPGATKVSISRAVWQSLKDHEADYFDFYMDNASPQGGPIENPMVMYFDNFIFIKGIQAHANKEDATAQLMIPMDKINAIFMDETVDCARISVKSTGANWHNCYVQGLEEITAKIDANGTAELRMDRLQWNVVKDSGFLAVVVYNSGENCGGAEAFDISYSGATTINHEIKTKETAPELNVYMPPVSKLFAKDGVNSINIKVTHTGLSAHNVYLKENAEIKGLIEKGGSATLTIDRATWEANKDNEFLTIVMDNKEQEELVFSYGDLMVNTGKKAHYDIDFSKEGSGKGITAPNENNAVTEVQTIDGQKALKFDVSADDGTGLLKFDKTSLGSKIPQNAVGVVLSVYIQGGKAHRIIPNVDLAPGSVDWWATMHVAPNRWVDVDIPVNILKRAYGVESLAETDITVAFFNYEGLNEAFAAYIRGINFVYAGDKDEILLTDFNDVTEANYSINAGHSVAVGEEGTWMYDGKGLVVSVNAGGEAPVLSLKADYLYKNLPLSAERITMRMSLQNAGVMHKVRFLSADGTKFEDCDVEFQPTTDRCYSISITREQLVSLYGEDFASQDLRISVIPSDESATQSVTVYIDHITASIEYTAYEIDFSKVGAINGVTAKKECNTLTEVQTIDGQKALKFDISADDGDGTLVFDKAVLGSKLPEDFVGIRLSVYHTGAKDHRAVINLVDGDWWYGINHIQPNTWTDIEISANILKTTYGKGDVNAADLANKNIELSFSNFDGYNEAFTVYVRGLDIVYAGDKDEILLTDFDDVTAENYAVEYGQAKVGSEVTWMYNNQGLILTPESGANRPVLTLKSAYIYKNLPEDFNKIMIRVGVQNAGVEQYVNFLSDTAAEPVKSLSFCPQTDRCYIVSITKAQLISLYGEDFRTKDLRLSVGPESGDNGSITAYIDYITVVL